MRLDVPFYVNHGADCGPVTLQMVLAYFGEEHALEELRQRCEQDSKGSTLTIGLAKAAAELGFPAEFYSTHLGFKPESFDNPFFERYGDGLAAIQEKVPRLQAACVAHGVKMQEQHLSADDICSRINRDCLAIVLVDWHRITGKPGFHGHFLVIVGYDSQHMLLHQPGPRDPTAFWPLEKSLFDTARSTPETDEDIVFIHRKR